MAELTVPDDALDLLRAVFLEVEGDCEAWTADDIVRKVFVRGAMEYAKSAGREWREVTRLATQVRKLIT